MRLTGLLDKKLFSYILTQRQAKVSHVKTCQRKGKVRYRPEMYLGRKFTINLPMKERTI